MYSLPDLESILNADINEDIQNIQAGNIVSGTGRLNGMPSLDDRNQMTEKDMDNTLREIEAGKFNVRKFMMGDTTGAYKEPTRKQNLIKKEMRINPSMPRDEDENDDDEDVIDDVIVDDDLPFNWEEGVDDDILAIMEPEALDAELELEDELEEEEEDHMEIGSRTKSTSRRPSKPSKDLPEGSKTPLPTLQLTKEVSFGNKG